MRRRWAWAAAAAVLLVGAAALAGLVPGRARPEPAAARTIWRAPWGHGGVAVVTGADGRRYGPLAFAVGRRQVVLADTFARRLLVIPLRGGAPAPVSLGAQGPLVEDLALGRGGTVYLADRAGTLWRWRPGLAAPLPVARLAAGERGLVWVEGLGVLPSGAPVVDLLSVTRRRAERSVFVLGPQGRRRPVVGLTLDEASPRRGGGPPHATVPAGGHSLAIGADGGIYLLGYAPGGGRAVYRYDASGRLVASVPAPGGPGHWSLLGVDRRGRIYLGLDLGGPRGRLRILSRRGGTLASRPLPMAGLVQMGTYVRVGAAGGLYVAEPGPGGLTLRRWPPLTGRLP